ncbi:MAG: DNA-binding transcriptional LysR family regulator [Saprospiraceae bacterium]
MADRRLQVFTTVARLLSFTKAAEALHMTQPAVTFQIRQLEEYFNARLFDRTHNKITLTDTGDLVKRYADEIIEKYKEMDNQVRVMTGDVQGPLVIGASTTIGDYVIPEILGEYQSKFPDVTIRLSISNTQGIIQMVENNEIDIGIVEGPVENKNLTTELYWQDELMLACPKNHALAGLDKVTVEQIQDYPYIGREEGSGTRGVFESYVKEQGVDPDAFNLILEFSSPESIKAAVGAGLGVSVQSVATLQKEDKLGLLSVVPLSPPLTRPFSLVYQRQKFRVQAMEEFLEFAQENSRMREKQLVK